MKVRENVTVYNCDFCNKRYLVKNACLLHETWCGSNPKNFPACSGCEHIEEYQKEIWVGEGEDGYSRNVTAFRCRAKGIGLYPAKVERLKINTRYPENFIGEELMPTSCNQFKDYLPF